MPKDNLQTLLLGHLGIGKTYLSDVIDDIHASHDNLPIDFVPISEESATARALDGMC
jgi:type II secretory pathway predicted ATPase ExeA